MAVWARAAVNASFWLCAFRVGNCMFSMQPVVLVRVAGITEWEMLFNYDHRQSFVVSRCDSYMLSICLSYVYMICSL